MSATAFHVLTKPIGPICNLDCKYCFYLEKQVLYPDTFKWAVPADVLEWVCAQDAEAAKPNKPGRNDLCSCGSGRKFKRCCAKTEMSACRVVKSKIADIGCYQ